MIKGDDENEEGDLDDWVPSKKRSVDADKKRDEPAEEQDWEEGSQESHLSKAIIEKTTGDYCDK